MDSRIVALVDDVYGYLIGLGNGRLTSFLTDWPPQPYPTRPITPTTLPVLAHLPQLPTATNDKTVAIVEQLQAIASLLHWGQTYTTADFNADFLQNYGWTELMGQRGPFASDKIACGFLLLGPNTTYPKHSHEAEEIYVPLSAPSQWVRGDGDWVARPAGVPIYHQSWLAHGMKTGATPLLALYLWRKGDLTQKSRFH